MNKYEMAQINPPPAPMTLPTANQLTVGSGGQKLTYGERKVMEEYRTQTAVIKGQAAKSIYAAREYSSVVRQVHDTAVATIAHIERTEATTRSDTVRAFCDREKQMYVYQTVEIIATAGMRLHDEVNRSLYPPPRRRW